MKSKNPNYLQLLAQGILLMSFLALAMIVPAWIESL